MNLTCGIDHLVGVITSLPDAQRAFRSIGLELAPRDNAGAASPESYFAYFEDGSYLQLCSFQGSSGPKHVWSTKIAGGEGWVDYSLRCDDASLISDAAASLAHRGPFAASGPGSGNKAWTVEIIQLGAIAGGPSSLPFFVRDLTDRDVRVPSPSSGLQRPTGIVGVTVVTANLHAIERALQLIFGEPTDISPRFPGCGRSALYHSGHAWLEFVEAGRCADLNRHLAQAGEGVFEIALGHVGETGPGSGRLLPLPTNFAGRIRSSLGSA